jgi:hemoglobin-like flavoprotein
VTPDQISLVRASWPAIAANADALTTNFYTSLFEIDDSAARLFAGVDMAAQRTKLAQSLAVVVSAIDDPGRLLSALAALGRRHVTYGIEGRHFDSVGHALLRAMSLTLGEHSPPRCTTHGPRRTSSSRLSCDGRSFGRTNQPLALAQPTPPTRDRHGTVVARFLGRTGKIREIRFHYHLVRCLTGDPVSRHYCAIVPNGVARASPYSPANNAPASRLSRAA